MWSNSFASGCGFKDSRLQKRQSAGDFFGFFGAKRTQKSPPTPKNAILAGGAWQREKLFQFWKNRPNGSVNPRTIIHRTVTRIWGTRIWASHPLDRAQVEIAADLLFEQGLEISRFELRPE